MSKQSFSSSKPVGKVIHIYDKIGVAIIDLSTGTLKIGDEIKFKHGEEEFKQKIESLQVEHESVDSVKKGDSFGVKVDKPTKVGTEVFLV